MTRSPTRMTMASTIWAAVAVPASATRASDTSVLFMRPPSTGRRPPLFVFGFRQPARISERQPFGQNRDLHFFAGFTDKLSDSILHLLVLQSFTNDRRGRLQADDTRRAALIHLENVKTRLCSYDGADPARFQREDLVLEHFRQLSSAHESDLTALFGVRSHGEFTGKCFERRAPLQLLLDVVGDTFVVNEDLADVNFLAGSKFAGMLVVIRAHFHVGGRRNIRRDRGDESFAAHVVAFLEDGGAGIVAHRGRDLLGGDLHAMRRGVFGTEDLT